MLKINQGIRLKITDYIGENNAKFSDKTISNDWDLQQSLGQLFLSPQDLGNNWINLSPKS